ncbi:MAG: redoxin domain-containing protein, partial [Clostridia bacterium]|nr:redoxin domain-containing protein [Clostridia bacterium]
ECIQCGECISVCPVQAISWKGSQIFLRNTLPLAHPAVAEGEKVDLLNLAKSNAVATVVTPEVTKESVSETAVADSQEEIKVAVSEENTAVTVKKNGAKEFFVKVKSAFKSPKFVVEFVAWVVALAVLLTALICYNLPEKKKDTVPAVTLTTYKSAASDGGQNYVSGGSGEKARLLYFWRTDLEDSVEGMTVLNEYAELVHGQVEVVAIHSIYKDGRDVQAFIDQQGWNEYNIIFVQDNTDANQYAYFGGDISVPQTITVSVNSDGVLAGQYTGAVSGEILREYGVKAQVGKVFRIGDYCPLFTLDCYNAEDGAKFSIYESRGKVTVLNFWYTNCDPCKAELPHFEEVYQEYGGEINMAVIHNWSGVPISGVQNFLDNNADANGKKWCDYTFTFAQDDKALDVYAMLYGRGAFPTTVVLDADGKIVFHKTSDCSKEELISAIESAKSQN